METHTRDGSDERCNFFSFFEIDVADEPLAALLRRIGKGVNPAVDYDRAGFDPIP